MSATIQSARTDSACELAVDITRAILRAAKRHGNDPALVAILSAGIGGGILMAQDCGLPLLGAMVAKNIREMEQDS